MVLVIKLGSAFFPPEKEKIKALKEYIKNKKAIIICGAGKFFKKYLERAGEIVANKGILDELGIRLTHVNALLLSEILGGVYVEDYREIPKILRQCREREPLIITTGGQFPGQSTDAVAALIAELIGAEEVLFVKALGGVFSDNPEINPKAEKLREVDTKTLKRFAEFIPGTYGPIDPVAIEIIERSGLRAWVVGLDFKKERGTRIVVSENVEEKE